MDNQTYKNGENRWVEERIASLTPPSEWNPDADHALQRVLQRKQPAPTRRWLPLSMVGAILAATAFVLVLLPWQVLWTPESHEKVGPIPSEPTVQPLSETAGKTVESASQSATAQFPVLDSSGAITSAAEREPERTVRSRQEVPSQTALALEPPAFIPTTPAAQPSPGLRPSEGRVSSAQQANVTEPVPISKVPAEYTQEAKDARIQGTVALLCLVKTDGTVTVESVKQSLGYGLDESAQWAVEQWQFIPGKKDGVPVPTQVTILVNFTLKKK